jgi:hypothetical protein
LLRELRVASSYPHCFLHYPAIKLSGNSSLRTWESLYINVVIVYIDCGKHLLHTIW